MTHHTFSGFSWLTLGLVMLGACGSDGDEKGPAECTSPGTVTEQRPDGTTWVGTCDSFGAADAQVNADAGPASVSNPVVADTGTMMANPGRMDAGSAPVADAGPAKDAGTPVPTGDASMPIDIGPAKPSAGCGKVAPMSGNAMIDVMGTAREYILTLPTDYDPKQPYKLIFAWHGLGGTAAQVASTYYGLKSRSMNSAIFVSGQGLPTSGTASGAGAGGAGWANANGQDLAFVKALYAQLQAQLCFDENRVFSVGMSYGGIMSNTLGCAMGDVFRAIAPMSGSGPGFGGRATCTGQVAVWMSNGDNDTVLSTSSERASKDFWVKTNHCQTTSAAVDPSPCVAFAGCDKDYPVTWCEFAGGHTVPAFSGAAIWTFFSQF